VLANDELHIIDISNPANPILVNTYATPYLAVDIHVAGGLISVADPDAGLQILRVNDPTQTYSIIGYVVDEDNIPIGSITITTDSGYSATSGDSGLYMLTGLPAGTYTLTPQASDFVPASRTVTIPPNAEEQNFAFNPGAAETSLYLPLVVQGGSSPPNIDTPTCSDAHEPNDVPAAGTSFAVGSTQSHAFCVSGDEDWIAFEATAGNLYRIETSNLASGADTVMELYDSNRETVLASNDDGGDGLASLIEYPADQAGTYYLKLHQYGNTGDPAYTYDLHIDSSTPEVQAVTFEYPSDGQILHYEGHYLFKVYAIDGADRYEWRFSQNGTELLLDENDNEYGIFAGTEAHNAFVAGDAEVQVRARVGGVWTDETTITIQLVASNDETACNDQYEPNNSQMDANTLVAGITQSHTFCVDGDEDWLTFSPTAGTTYHIETSNLAPGTDTVMELYDRDGRTMIALDDDSGDGLASVIPFDVGVSGTYYIKLRQYGNTGDTSYTYDVHVRAIHFDNVPTPHPAPVFEYPSDGQVLNYEGSYLFKVQPVDNAQLYLWEFSQNGNELWSESVHGQSSDNEYGIHNDNDAHSLFVPGNVDVRVRTWVDGSWSEAAVITIELRADDTPTCDDAYEPDDSVAAARALEVGTTQSHAFCTDGDEDWIVFAASAEATYRLETLNLSTGTDTVLELYDSTGTTRLAVDDDGGEGRASRLEYTFSQAGNYAIKVRPYSSAGDPAYTYAVQVEEVTTPDDNEQKFTEQVIGLTNQERAQYGCPALTANDQLTNAAQRHSRDMAINDYFSHTGLYGSSLFDRIAREGYQYRTAAENIAAGSVTPEHVVAGWMNSEGHRKNILNCDLREIGVGYYYLENDTGDTNYKHYWTQVFGTPR
jgi:uncharacterized protein YkwD